MPAEAINHALAAGEHGRVVALLERHGWALLNVGYTHTLEGWLRALPAGLAGSSPRISLDFGWMRLLRGALDQVGPLLAQAEAALDARAAAAGAAALRAECLALRANLLQAGGRAAEAIAAAERSLALTAATDHRLIGLASLALGGAYRQTPDFERAVAALQRASQAAQAAGDRVTDMLAVAHLTLMATQYGRLRLAAEAATEALQRLAQEHAAPPPIIGAVYGALGLIHYQWNDLELAQEQLRRGIRLGTLTGHSASVIYSQCNLARLLQAGGDLAGAAQALEAAGRLLAQGVPGLGAARADRPAGEPGLGERRSRIGGRAGCARAASRQTTPSPITPIPSTWPGCACCWSGATPVRPDWRSVSSARLRRAGVTARCCTR